ncbi:ribosome small subunit-dependent GTPase A [Peribacillus sp. SCS-26]|uniref:ribosome small subunit-dependent GTPase A n=1 Tax=Paraperibacillus marinus TaxID=3115295 RepID=UPI003905EA3C
METGSTIAGRVIAEYRNLYKVAGENGLFICEPSGRMKFNAGSQGALPAVGDWVAFTERAGEEKGTIHAVLPRKSTFSRKKAGTEPAGQIIAVNVDYIFIVLSLNLDFNVRRLERYLISIWESGASPVIILNKADLCPDAESKRKELEKAASGIPVIIMSALQRKGHQAVFEFLTKGSTGVFTGSSGVGKSTLINSLLNGAVQKTAAIRDDDDKGRHATTHRELFALENGSYIIDVPGMREFGLWDTDEGLSAGFSDIDALSGGCFYQNCRHLAEPQCAVKAAIEEGRLEAGRLNSFLKLQKEQEYLERKLLKTRMAEEKKKNKKRAKNGRGS